MKPFLAEKEFPVWEISDSYCVYFPICTCLSGLETEKHERVKAFVNKALSSSNLVVLNIMQSFSKSNWWSCFWRFMQNRIFGIVFTALIALEACLDVSFIADVHHVFEKRIQYLFKCSTFSKWNNSWMELNTWECGANTLIASKSITSWLHSLSLTFSGLLW